MNEMHALSRYIVPFFSEAEWIPPIPISDILVYDAAMLISKAIRKMLPISTGKNSLLEEIQSMDTRNYSFFSDFVDCNQNAAWPHGFSLYNFLNSVCCIT